MIRNYSTEKKKKKAVFFSSSNNAYTKGKHVTGKEIFVPVQTHTYFATKPFTKFLQSLPQRKLKEINFQNKAWLKKHETVKLLNPRTTQEKPS